MTSRFTYKTELLRTTNSEDLTHFVLKAFDIKDSSWNVNEALEVGEPGMGKWVEVSVSQPNEVSDGTLAAVGKWVQDCCAGKYPYGVDFFDILSVLSYLGLIDPGTYLVSIW